MIRSGTPEDIKKEVNMIKSCASCNRNKWPTGYRAITILNEYFANLADCNSAGNMKQKFWQHFPHLTVYLETSIHSHRACWKSLTESTCEQFHSAGLTDNGLWEKVMQATVDPYQAKHSAHCRVKQAVSHMKTDLDNEETGKDEDE
ncbi:hypothetical protein GYMLUDRAFT_63244 [Collybiopsis luxurians FD-317 M1]|uniref:Uncharacterized protein n=1 Tax=Collybiopsis luxurians FD-317 M1 TaxID=944289 RepID=A0A0D0CH66_9AGAR|nr:hypothetical protein GYMLUDRAFT_63244 [Collybiopsis luxurians FD-317 M1]